MILTAYQRWMMARLIEERKRIGLSQAEMARRLGVSPVRVNMLEHGRKRAGPEILDRYADALGYE